MLIDAYRDERSQIRTVYRTDGHPLNSRHTHTRRRIATTTVHDLLFVDDCALNIATETDVRWSMDLFADGCVKFGLATDTDKTVASHTSSHNTVYDVPRTIVYGTQLKTMNNFAYLSSTLSRSIKIDDKVTHWNPIANQASVWNGHRLRLNEKL
ncbi:hypothetical protein SprV_0100151500 [Sparganum proliferum]